jgi:protein-S-isoprenylcysteine O-methyltransferase Ste14
MDTLRRDIANLIKVLSALLVTGLGSWMLSTYNDTGWVYVPKICGSIMVVAGAAACVFFLWQKTLRIRLEGAEKELSAGPVSEGEKKV